MLHDAQRTSAPSATSVSINTAVWMVMCSEPVIRAPASGWRSAYSRRVAIRPGISCSASWISLRPKPAKARSATLKSVLAAVVLISSPGVRVFRVGAAPSGDGQQLLMLGLLEAEPVVGLHVGRPLRFGLKPALHGIAKLAVGVHARRERDVGEAETEPLQQLFER